MTGHLFKGGGMKYYVYKATLDSIVVYIGKALEIGTNT